MSFPACAAQGQAQLGHQMRPFLQLGVIERRLNALEKMLDGKDHIMGAAFTAPDAYLFTVLNWTTPLKIDLKRWPNITAFMARVGSRPTVKETLKAEGLVG